MFLCYCSGLAEVNVNTKTGEVKVHKIFYAADAGRFVNPQSFEGQCEGGIVFGLSLARKEGYILGGTRALKVYTRLNLGHAWKNRYQLLILIPEDFGVLKKVER